MSGESLDEEAIFHIARVILDPELRSRYLDQVCSGDQALRERVNDLLAAYELEQSFLKSALAQVAPTLAQEPISEAPGQEIGRYKLLQKIGEGGFGVVFMAEQVKPVRRKVALKVIKPGMDTHAVIARFEAERQALALMDHQNIARVLDGGATDSGRPYFVMELVKGAPITEYCDQNQLSTDERLKLFMTICQAVQHAHQKGIIHRDLKPSNVLVTLADGQPVVKVIDFGVAKATNQQLTEKTLFTAYGQMVGTPQYMSPEQAEMSCLDVDTRSDVYSLGVILYELLTGTTPLEAEKLRTAGYVEMQRLIREDEPPKPSTRLSTSGDKLTMIAKHRSVSPERLKSQVRGDLDWIVMKALDKDRSRRYSTANSFSDDVQRFLEVDIVEARPPSVLYRYRKYFRRHRASVLSAATVAVAIFTLTVWALVQRNNALQSLSTLQETARAEAIFHALNCDESRMHKMMEVAQQAGAPPGWSKMVLAISALFAGDPETSIRQLEGALELNEATLAVRSLLAESHFYAGNYDKMLELGLPLVHEEPSGVEDRIFLSLFLARNNQQRSFQLAKEAFEQQRSPITLLVKANARSHLAMDTGDSEEGQLAVEESDAARMLLPDSRFATFVCLTSRLDVMSRARISHNKELAQRYEVEGERLAKQLSDTPNYTVGQLAAAWYFEAIDNKPLALAQYKEAARIGKKEIYIQQYAQCLIRMGMFQEAEPELVKLSPSIWKALTISEVDGMRPEARAMLESQIPQASPALQPFGLGALCELGYPEAAKALAESLLESDLIPNDKVHKGMLTLFAGQSSPRQLLALVGEDATDRGLALLVAAQIELGHGNALPAKQYLSESVRVLQGFITYDRAKHLLYRLAENPAPWWGAEIVAD